MRLERITTRGGFVESPENTFTLTVPTETTLKTGITEFKLVNSTDGSYSADIEFTFVGNAEAVDFRLHNALFLLCSDYGEFSINLPEAVVNKISDTWTFSDEATYNDFLRQVKGDLSLTLVLPLPYYEQ